MYKIVQRAPGGEFVLRVEDGMQFPMVEDNRDYREYLAWVAEGNEPAREVSTVEALLDYANTKQWARVTGGFTATLNGAPCRFACDATSAAFMSSKLKRLALPDPPAEFGWQLLTGDFVTIQAADFEPLAVKLEAYVQATFDACRALMDAIFAGLVTTQAQIDAWAWPVDHD